MQLHIWSFFDECSGPATLDEFFTILSWSFAALQTGKWPETNHLGQTYDPDSHEGKLAGTLLADGFPAIVWSLVGDLEYMASVLKLPHYSNKTNPCALCKCSGGTDDNSWKDCRLSANWFFNSLVFQQLGFGFFLLGLTFPTKRIIGFYVFAFHSGGILGQSGPHVYCSRSCQG